MKIHKEGKNTIIISSILLLISSIILSYFLREFSLLIIIPLFIIWILIIWFFRDPERNYSFSEHEVVAPVDGKVVEIKEVYEKEILKTNCIQVSIFMSPLNVHVCRYPVSGNVIYTKYHPGKYLVAWHEKSSELNERTTVCVENKTNKIAFRQIAGAVARRIVIYSKEGTKALAGKEYGFIKFGSRLDVFLPLDAKIIIKKGDKTIGGKQIIAQL